MAIWKPSDGYFGTLLAALMGRALHVGAGDQITGTAGMGGGQVVSPDSALRLSAVWACVKLISEAVGCMPIRLWKISRNGERELVKDHWLYYLLNFAPNSYQTRNEFIETMMINLLLSGNAFVAKTKSLRATEITSLAPLMSPQVTVKLGSDNKRTYRYNLDGNTLVYAQDSMWHLPLMPSNTLVGLSPIQYGARTMGIAMAAEDRVSKMAENGFKPTGVLMIDHALKHDQREQIRKEFADLIEGQGDPLKVLEAGMKYQAISISPRDAQLIETRQFSIEDICRFWGVPSILINDTSASTTWGTGIGEIKQGFYTLTLQPILERFESSALRWLLPSSEWKDWQIEFDFSAFLRGDDASRVTWQAAAVAGNLLTINEARSLEGRSPVPHGDKMYAQSQMIPIGTSAAPGVVDRRKGNSDENR